MEGGQTIIDPPDQQGASSRALDKKPMVFSFGELLIAGFLACAKLTRQTSRTGLPDRGPSQDTQVRRRCMMTSVSNSWITALRGSTRVFLRVSYDVCMAGEC